MTEDSKVCSEVPKFKSYFRSSILTNFIDVHQTSSKFGSLIKSTLWITRSLVAMSYFIKQDSALICLKGWLQVERRRIWVTNLDSISNYLICTGSTWVWSSPRKFRTNFQCTNWTSKLPIELLNLPLAKFMWNSL